MKRKIVVGVLLGVISGIIDIIPMIIQKISWEANLSAFMLWVICGFMIATSSIKINAVFKGIIISFLLVIPVGIIVGAQDFASLIPIAVMTIVLGSLLGFSINKFGGKNE